MIDDYYGYQFRFYVQTYTNANGTSGTATGPQENINTVNYYGKALIR